ncbi:MAG: protein jag [Endomicrobiales bacterium]|nr:protein jag [Endomicrobiales bacterium]
MTEIEVEGKTIEEAIQEGLTKLGCSQDKVEIKILNEGTSGLFGLMGNKPAKVQLTTKEKTTDFSAAQKRIKEILNSILDYMNLKHKDIKTSIEAGRIKVDIKSDESKFIIGKNGQTLEALEHISTLILNKDVNTRTKINLDTDNYRKQQETRIQNIALKAANQVKQTGKSYRFDPMPAKERRLLHLSLQNHPDVETTSEGEGMFRKVIVRLKK